MQTDHAAPSRTHIRAKLGRFLLGLAACAASLPLAGLAAAPREAAYPPERDMIVFAWNYTPDPSTSPVKRAVQAYFDFGPANVWKDRRITFYVDDRTATPREAIARLREVPVLTWAHPYHYEHVKDAPANFASEAVEATNALIAQAKDALLAVSDEAFISKINHVVDFENFADASKPSLVPGASFAVRCDHASTACHLFGAALKLCKWEQRGGAGAANNHTAHGPKCPPLGTEPNFRQTPYHVPGSMDGRTTFLSGYTSGGTYGCMTEEEVLNGIEKARGPVWLVIEDYQPGRANIIRAAKASGKVRVLGLWGTDFHEGKPEHAPQNRQRNKQWAKRQDARIAEELRLAGVDLQ